MSSFSNLMVLRLVLQASVTRAADEILVVDYSAGSL